MKPDFANRAQYRTLLANIDHAHTASREGGPGVNVCCATVPAKSSPLGCAGFAVLLQVLDASLEKVEVLFEGIKLFFDCWIHYVECDQFDKTSTKCFS